MAYIYYSYEQFGRGYIGFRNCDPEGDEAYMGSFRDRSFQPTEKIILATFAEAREALAAEVALHEFFDVASNPHFANRARQTCTTFTTAGITQDEEWKEKAMKNLHTPETRAKALQAQIAANRELKVNAFHNPKLRAAARALAVEANKKNGTGCCHDNEWQNQRRLKHNWSKEAWEALEEGNNSGKRYWGFAAICKKFSISGTTGQTMLRHIREGKRWEDLFDA